MNEENAAKVIEERLGNQDFVCNRIVFSRDAIIEASAGTGKTYTLQSIVLRLLKEKMVDSVKNLLLVTFTEKAAGELKDRIRDVLDQAGLLPADFDEVSICTIHSFCRELLTEYAFENRVPMETEIGGSDRPLIHQSVLEALHSSRYAEDRKADFGKLMTTAGLTADKLVKAAEGQFSKTGELSEDEGTGRSQAQLKKAAHAKLVNHLVRLAKEAFTEKKSQTSTMTFDDLVDRAHDVIVKEARFEAAGKTSSLLDSIRHKYRIALVDEFQDTDGKQWDIFRSIFSHEVNRVADGPEPKQGSLLVVGDPKQAIYSFRGADIATYLAAKKAITGGRDDKVLTLDTTYRSEPALVAAFNDIFGKKVGDDTSWFENMQEGEGRIDYADVKSAGNSRKFNQFKPHAGLGRPVELLESLPGRQKDPTSAQSGYGNKSRCLAVFLRNAALEMKRLMSLKPAYTTVDPDTNETREHALAYRDMCVLVRGHGEAAKAQEILTMAGIPFSVYKEQGIYDSAEAEALLALFDFLAVPSRRGRLEALLLTPFFGYRPDQLEARRRQEDRGFAKLLDAWQELVAKREWSLFFEHVMNDTLLAHPHHDDPDFDRRWSAIRQILDRLLEQVGRKAQTIDEFADTLRAWRKNDQLSGENGALRRKESEADCVQIMTMHVSKGLEFPVVFVAWGFGRLERKNEGDEEKKIHVREEKRLLYVALTRAEYRLYLPWSQWAEHRRIAVSKDRKTKVENTTVAAEIGIGSVGSALLVKSGAKNPDFGFLARGIRAHFGSYEMARTAVVETFTRLRQFESESGGAAGERAPAEKVAVASPITVYELDGDVLARQCLENVSYSTVHKGNRRIAEPMECSSCEDENHDLASAQKREPTLLPRTNVSGDVFHEIMETLCKTDDSDNEKLGFCTVGHSELRHLTEDADSQFMKLIARSMYRHQLASQKNQQGDTTELTLARMVWRALNVPIEIGGKRIVLKEVKAADRRAELEFVVNRALMLGEEPAAEDDPRRDNAFNGKIDLLIRPEGRGGPVYVLDWKTSSLSDFAPQTLARAMTASDYHLQYQFYSQAVRTWLRGTELGGVAYLFVRAGEKSEQAEGDTGVFVAPAEAIAQESCRAAIKNGLE